MRLKKKLKNSVIHPADFSLLGSEQRIGILPNKMALFDSFEGMGIGEYMKLQVAVLVFVLKGSCHVELDLIELNIKERGVVIAFPDQVAHIIETSADFSPLCVVASRDMVEEMTIQIPDALRMELLAKNNQYIQLDSIEFDQLVMTYRFLQKKMLSTKDNPYRVSILKNVLLSLAYESIGYMIGHLRLVPTTLRKDVLFKTFVKLVTENHQQEHSVKYYAKKICVSPKYLTAIVESISGKSAKCWIDEYIVLDAKVLLRSTEKDISIIADELNFVDMSYFGKFFKRMTGISPKKYRNKESL